MKQITRFVTVALCLAVSLAASGAVVSATHAEPATEMPAQGTLQEAAAQGATQAIHDLAAQGVTMPPENQQAAVNAAVWTAQVIEGSGAAVTSTMMYQSAYGATWGSLRDVSSFTVTPVQTGVPSLISPELTVHIVSGTILGTAQTAAVIGTVSEGALVPVAQSAALGAVSAVARAPALTDPALGQLVAAGAYGGAEGALAGLVGAYGSEGMVVMTAGNLPVEQMAESARGATQGVLEGVAARAQAGTLPTVQQTRTVAAGAAANAMVATAYRSEVSPEITYRTAYQSAWAGITTIAVDLDDGRFRTSTAPRART